MTDVNDLVRIRIEDARRKIEAAKRQRAEQQRLRTAGLAKRHAAKLRALRDRGLGIAPVHTFDNTTPAASGA
ncbi:hypothetical protein PV350_35420 [Streptomyces sp. PA03-6a]|nr:hypothetical protein [Streptomyces sp. PA03-6a]